MWLNESFATFVGKHIAHSTHLRLGDSEKFEHMHCFITDTKLGAQSLDSKVSSHPVQSKVTKISQFDSIFDAISYNKGGMLLYQLHTLIGHETWCKGIRQYLEKFKHSNAENLDLWQCLSEVSGKDILSLMNYWISTTGFPCVKISLDEKYENILLEQDIYLSEKKSDQKCDKIWPIPFAMSYRTKSGKAVDFETIFNSKSLSIKISPEDPIESIKINPDCRSFFVYCLSKPLCDIAVKNFSYLHKTEKTDFFNNICPLVIFNSLAFEIKYYI